MTDVKKPQDRKPKAEEVAEELFTFTVDGKEHVFPVAKGDVFTKAFVRKSRKLPELHQLFEVVEGLAGGDEDLLDMYDNLPEGDDERFHEELSTYLGAELGK